jgi:hypothetical protein
MAQVGISDDEWGGGCTDVHVHNLWINLLISMWGREVNGQ